VPEIREQARAVARDIDLFVAARSHQAVDARAPVEAPASLAI
jgi:hypothetical protein